MKTVAVVLLAITAVTAENLLCQPNSFFKIDCNTCNCAEDGKTYACTDMVCPPKNLNRLAADQLPEKYCAPGSFFKLDCNTCTCSEDGTFAACTDMICPPEITNYDMAPKPKQVCKPLLHFKEYCNTCFCSEDGTTYGCTMMDCDKNVWNRDGTKKVFARAAASAPKQVCEPNTQFKDYCNTCFCSEDGLSFGCTYMDCDKNIWNRDGSRKVAVNLQSAPKQVCTPYSQFKDYCNTCFCSEDGLSFGCTYMDCDKNVWNKNGTKKVPKQVCQPRSLFNDYCNTCSCADDGLSYSCTRMFCDKNIWNKDGSRKFQIKNLPSILKQVCTPLKQFKEYCNTCTCSKDGTFAVCTRMFCDKDVWNKNGTTKVQIRNLPSEDSTPKQVCQPRAVFKEYCNTCSCAADGLTYACTRMYCDKAIWNKNGTRKVEIRNLPSEDSTPKQVCQPRAVFKEYCNTCRCSENGLSYACTRMYCDKDIYNRDGTMKVHIENLDNEVSAPKQVCQPRAVFKEYCNTCSCAADGLTYACTRMYCDKAIWNKNGTRKVEIKNLPSFPKQVCTPLKQFKDYCNTCTCSKDGTFAVCTRMFCDKDVWNKDGSMKKNKKQVCEPGSAYKVDECNTCVCNEDGTYAACTIKFCQPAVRKASVETEQKKWGPVYKQGDACTPGKLFYSECNTCVCTKSGNSAFCTFMNCEEEEDRDQ